MDDAILERVQKTLDHAERYGHRFADVTADDLRALLDENARLLREVENLMPTDHGGDRCACGALLPEISSDAVMARQSLRTEVARLRGTLEFYADDANYMEESSRHSGCAVLDDLGDKARAALAPAPEEGNS